MKETIESMVEEMEPRRPEDIARSIRYAVSQPSHVTLNEILIQPTRHEP